MIKVEKNKIEVVFGKDTIASLGVHQIEKTYDIIINNLKVPKKIGDSLNPGDIHETPSIKLSFPDAEGFKIFKIAVDRIAMGFHHNMARTYSELTHIFDMHGIKISVFQLSIITGNVEDDGFTWGN